MSRHSKMFGCEVRTENGFFLTFLVATISTLITRGWNEPLVSLYVLQSLQTDLALIAIHYTFR